MAKNESNKHCFSFGASPELYPNWEIKIMGKFNFPIHKRKLVAHVIGDKCITGWGHFYCSEVLFLIKATSTWHVIAGNCGYISVLVQSLVLRVREYYPQFDGVITKHKLRSTTNAFYWLNHLHSLFLIFQSS